MVTPTKSFQHLHRGLRNQGAFTGSVSVPVSQDWSDLRARENRSLEPRSPMPVWQNVNLKQKAPRRSREGTTCVTLCLIAENPWLSLGNILHVCLLWLSG